MKARIYKGNKHFNAIKSLALSKCDRIKKVDFNNQESDKFLIEVEGGQVYLDYGYVSVLISECEFISLIGEDALNDAIYSQEIFKKYKCEGVQVAINTLTEENKGAPDFFDVYEVLMLEQEKAKRYGTALNTENETELFL